VIDRRPLRFAILGAGMAGLLSAVRLKEAGEAHFTVYEKGDKVGGTWRENRYPGLTCDVPSHSYTYSFAPNPDWSRRAAARFNVTSSRSPIVTGCASTYASTPR